MLAILPLVGCDREGLKNAAALPVAPDPRRWSEGVSATARLLEVGGTGGGGRRALDAHGLGGAEADAQGEAEATGAELDLDYDVATGEFRVSFAPERPGAYVLTLRLRGAVVATPLGGVTLM